MSKRRHWRGRPARIPVPENRKVLIVLTGLEHTEAGGRQFVFCTAGQSSEGFFLYPKDMASPDGGKDLAACCADCRTEKGEPESHWIVDFKTALFEGYVDTETGGYIVTPLSIIRNLMERGLLGSILIREGPSRRKRAAS